MNDVTEYVVDVFDLIRAVWKNALIIALVAILFGCAAFGYTVFCVEPEYQATASMYANNSTFNLGATSFSVSSSDLSASNSLVSAYLYILESRTTLEEVIQIADLKYTPDQLKGMISTSSVSKTSAFEVTVTSTDPSEAELIANSIAQILPERITEIVDGTSVRIVDYAIIPSQRSGPSVLKNTILGILVGAILSVVVVLVRSLLDDTDKVMIHSADELRAMYPDIMVLTTIPDMRMSDEKNGYYSAYYTPEKTDKGKKGGKRSGRQ